MKRLGLILFALIIIYFIFLIHQDIIDNLGLKREKEEAIKSVQQQEKIAEELQNRLENINVEKLARTRLGLVKKGETAYKVINDK